MSLKSSAETLKFTRYDSSHGSQGSQGSQGPQLFMHSEYVKKVIGHVLVKCLKDVVEVRPADPIEYMAQWLYKYTDSELYYYRKVLEMKQAEMLQLEIEKVNSKRAAHLQFLRKKLNVLKEESWELTKFLNEKIYQDQKSRRKEFEKLAALKYKSQFDAQSRDAILQQIMARCSYLLEEESTESEEEEAKENRESKEEGVSVEEDTQEELSEKEKDQAINEDEDGPEETDEQKKSERKKTAKKGGKRVKGRKQFFKVGNVMTTLTRMLVSKKRKHMDDYDNSLSSSELSSSSSSTESIDLDDSESLKKLMESNKIDDKEYSRKNMKKAERKQLAKQARKIPYKARVLRQVPSGPMKRQSFKTGIEVPGAQIKENFDEQAAQKLIEATYDLGQYTIDYESEESTDHSSFSSHSKSSSDMETRKTHRISRRKKKSPVRDEPRDKQRTKDTFNAPHSQAVFAKRQPYERRYSERTSVSTSMRSSRTGGSSGSSKRSSRGLNKSYTLYDIKRKMKESPKSQKKGKAGAKRYGTPASRRMDEEVGSSSAKPGSKKEIAELKGLQRDNMTDGKESSTESLQRDSMTDGKRSSTESLQPDSMTDGKRSSTESLQRDRMKDGKQSSTASLQRDNMTDGKQSRKPSFQNGLLRSRNSSLESEKDIKMATWKNIWGHHLICEHPCLGDLVARPPIMSRETPDWWEQQNFIPQSLYDHEVFSRDNDDTVEAYDPDNPILTLRSFVIPGPFIRAQTTLVPPVAKDQYTLNPEQFQFVRIFKGTDSPVFMTETKHKLSSATPVKRPRASLDEKLRVSFSEGSVAKKRNSLQHKRPRASLDIESSAPIDEEPEKSVTKTPSDSESNKKPRAIVDKEPENSVTKIPSDSEPRASVDKEPENSVTKTPSDSKSNKKPRAIVDKEPEKSVSKTPSDSESNKKPRAIVDKEPEKSVTKTPSDSKSYKKLRPIVDKEPEKSVTKTPSDSKSNKKPRAIVDKEPEKSASKIPSTLPSNKKPRAIVDKEPEKSVTKIPSASESNKKPRAIVDKEPEKSVTKIPSGPKDLLDTVPAIQTDEASSTSKSKHSKDSVTNSSSALLNKNPSTDVIEGPTTIIPYASLTRNLSGASSGISANEGPETSLTAISSSALTKRPSTSLNEDLDTFDSKMSNTIEPRRSSSSPVKKKVNIYSDKQSETDGNEGCSKSINERPRKSEGKLSSQSGKASKKVSDERVNSKTHSRPKSLNATSCECISTRKGSDQNADLLPKKCAAGSETDKTKDISSIIRKKRYRRSDSATHSDSSSSSRSLQFRLKLSPKSSELFNAWREELMDLNLFGNSVWWEDGLKARPTKVSLGDELNQISEEYLNRISGSAGLSGESNRTISDENIRHAATDSNQEDENNAHLTRRCGSDHFTGLSKNSLESPQVKFYQGILGGSSKTSSEEESYCTRRGTDTQTGSDGGDTQFHLSQRAKYTDLDATPESQHRDDTAHSKSLETLSEKNNTRSVSSRESNPCTSSWHTMDSGEQLALPRGYLGLGYSRLRGDKPSYFSILAAHSRTSTTDSTTLTPDVRPTRVGNEAPPGQDCGEEGTFPIDSRSDTSCTLRGVVSLDDSQRTLEYEASDEDFMEDWEEDEAREF